MPRNWFLNMDYWDVTDEGPESACDCCPYAVLTGAAVAFGLMGMAEAIADMHWLEACPVCGKAGSSRVYAEPGSYDIDKHDVRPWMCMPCNRAMLSPSDAEKK